MRVWRNLERRLYKALIGLFYDYPPPHKEAPGLAVSASAIIPHGYGLDTKGNLMRATREAFRRAWLTALNHPDALLYLVSTNYDEESRRREEKEKLKDIGQVRLRDSRTVTVPAGAKNTVDEVREVSRLLGERRCGRLIIVCEIAQLPRAKKIWRHYCPEATFEFCTVVGEWTQPHGSWWLRSPLRWLVSNWLAHALLIIRGVEGGGKIAHRIKTAAV